MQIIRNYWDFPPEDTESRLPHFRQALMDAKHCLVLENIPFHGSLSGRCPHSPSAGRRATQDTKTIRKSPTHCMPA